MGKKRRSSHASASRGSTGPSGVEIPMAIANDPTERTPDAEGAAILGIGLDLVSRRDHAVALEVLQAALVVEDSGGRQSGPIACRILREIARVELKLGLHLSARTHARRLLQTAPDGASRQAARRILKRLPEPSEPERSASHVGFFPLFKPEAVDPGTTFSDVGGMVDAKDAISRLAILPLREPQRAVRYGIEPGGGVLLYGPPGCGKTMLARATAGEMGVKFIQVRGSDLLHPFYGMAERNTVEAFRVARELAPCVLFFDELDGIAQCRDTDFFHRSLVNVLLVEMEAPEKSSGVLLVAATNDIDRIDDAVKRPGRLDKLVYVGPPDAPAREAIWRMNLAIRPVTDDVDYHVLVELSEGMTGADIAAASREAAEVVFKQNLVDDIDRSVGMIDLLAAIRRLYADGVRKARIDELIGEYVRGLWDSREDEDWG